MVRRESMVRMVSSAAHAHIMPDVLDGAMTMVTDLRRGRPWRIAAAGLATWEKAMRAKTILAAAFWLCTCAGVAAAQTAAPSTKTDEMSFLAADTNGDGLVDEAELAADQAKRFKQLDASGDGFLTPDELDAHTAAMFAAIDRNGDGKLSFIEVMTAKMNDFKRADVNGDGRVSYQEIVVFEGKQ